MKKAYTFALNCGYAENGSLSYTPFTSHLKYASVKEALLDLAKFFKEQYDLRNAPTLKTCCKAALAKDSSVLYCPKCGRPVAEELDFDEEAFCEYVRGACESDCDSFHSSYIDYDESFRWQPEGLESAVESKSVRFVYTAEKVMAAAIGHSPHPDKVTIESIFKDRTEGGGKSFSFW